MGNRNFLVLGAGRMGRVAAADLINSDKKNVVTLADISFDNLRRAQESIKNDRLITLQRDIEDESQLQSLFEDQDVSVCALLHRHSLLVMGTAVMMGVDYVDMVGENTLERMAFHDEALKKEITVLSGMGVSPGITNMCVGWAVDLLDETENALIYVGGNPVDPKPPLNYRIVYALDSLLNFYEREALLLRRGIAVKVPPLSSVEQISFQYPFEEMECFYTEGLNSMAHTLKKKIKGELSEKTIRHKGHSDGIKTLKECGLFSRKPVEIQGQKMKPRDLLEVLLQEKMDLGEEKDVILLRIHVTGLSSNKSTAHTFEMIDCYDSEKHFTSMAKTTAFPASIAAQMIVAEQMEQKGVVFPEQVFNGELFIPMMEELKKRGVIISHTVHH